MSNIIHNSPTFFMSTVFPNHIIIYLKLNKRNNNNNSISLSVTNKANNHFLKSGKQ